MALRIEAVEGRSGRRRFVELARTFRGGHPSYVPAITGEITKLLDPRRNPAFRHAHQALWIARDESGTPLGRVAATYDPRHAENLGENAGWFGFFDATDPQTAAALLETAWGWVREQGGESMLGPADPDTNHECGCLIEGHEELPYLMMPHHPAAYAEWIAAAGLEKAKDLLAYEVHSSTIPMARMKPMVERSLSRGGIRMEQISKRNLGTLLEVARLVYNEAWRDNWGFLPMTAEEFAFEAEGMKMLLLPELAHVAWKGDQPAGFVLGLPDANVALKKVNGRLFPFGFLRLLYLLPRLERLRVLALGVLPEHRGRGLDAALVYTLVDGAARKNLHLAEMSWVLEDNEPMNRLARTFGGEVSRRYRIFRKKPAG